MERAAVKQPPAVAATPLAAAGSAGAPSAAAPSRGPHRLADFALGPQAAEEPPVEAQAQEQVQVLAQAAVHPDDLRAAAAALERRAIDAITALASVKEELAHADTPDAMRDVLHRFAAAARAMDVISHDQPILAADLARAEEKPPEVAHALRTVDEIVRTFRGEANTFWAAHTERHRDALDALGTASTAAERARIPRAAASDRLGADDIREINNWVAGGWSTLNKFLFGTESADDVALRAHIMANGDAGNRFSFDLEQRAVRLQMALSQAPKFVGTTYRRAQYAGPEVYRDRIRPGAYVSSPGFFTSSHVKGADAAGGGAAGWGQGNMAYFQITGTSAVDLSPYQAQLRGEREVLFPRNAVFEVQAIEITGQTVKVILQQVVAIPDGTVTLDPYSGLPTRQVYL
jgi:hypothetical protein